MFKNKKSQVMTSLIRTIIAVVALFVIAVPACNYVREVLSGSSESFEAFVDRINEMPPESSGQFVLELNKNSVVIGFNRDTTRWECYNCYVGVQSRATIIFNRPDSPECNEDACICLCDKTFKLEGENPEIGKCGGKLLCKKLEQDVDIVSKTIIKMYPGFTIPLVTIGGGIEHWNYGFLFANDIFSGANGLKKYDEGITLLYVEKKNNEIGVCNEDMMNYNKEKLDIDGCINKDWAP